MGSSPIKGKEASAPDRNVLVQVDADANTTLSRLGSLTVSEEKVWGLHWKNTP